MPASPSQPIFEIYVDDDRYAVPTLHLVAAKDEADARAIVDRLLCESVHHLGAELCFEGRLLSRLGSYIERPRERRAAFDAGPVGAADAFRLS